MDPADESQLAAVHEAQAAVKEVVLEAYRAIAAAATAVLCTTAAVSTAVCETSVCIHSSIA